MNRSTTLALAAFIPLMATGSCAAATAPDRAGHSTAAASSGDALTVCRQALPSLHVVSGTWTTVGELRSWGYGPMDRHPLADAFPSAGPADQAAWCWTIDAPDSYTAWGVRTPHGAQRAMTVTGPTKNIPSGAPVVP
jgi:hypothetical protein